MTSRPAEILGLETGRLAVGAPADFILIDLDYPWQVKEADFRSRSRNTAFEGAKLAVSQVNEQGGILDGQKLEIISGDSTCADATAASNAADRMVNSEKVTALVGPLCSGETIAAANNAAIPGGVVIVSPAATSTE